MGLLAAEVRKLTTVRTTWIVTAIGWALAGLGTAFFVFDERMTGAFGGSDEEVAGAIGQVGGNSIIVLVVAVLVMSTEFRHGTIGRSLQLTPSRTRVLVAKLAAGVAYAAFFFVGGLAVVVAALAAGGAVRGFAVDLGSATVEALWQGPAALALTALFGVAVGALLRSQVVTLTLALVWVFVAEQLISAFLPEVGRWLPFQALNSIFVAQEVMIDGEPVGGMVDPLAPGAALTLFLGYVLVATVLAAVLMRVRDV